MNKNPVKAHDIGIFIMVSHKPQDVFEHFLVRPGPFDKDVSFMHHRINMLYKHVVEILFQFVMKDRRPKHPVIRECYIIPEMRFVIAIGICRIFPAIGQNRVFRDVRLLHRIDHQGDK